VLSKEINWVLTFLGWIKVTVSEHVSWWVHRMLSTIKSIGDKATKYSLGMCGQKRGDVRITKKERSFWVQCLESQRWWKEESKVNKKMAKVNTRKKK